MCTTNINNAYFIFVIGVSPHSLMAMGRESYNEHVYKYSFNIFKGVLELMKKIVIVKLNS